MVPELTVRDRVIGSQHANTLEAAAGFFQRVLIASACLVPCMRLSSRLSSAHVVFKEARVES